MELKPCPFCNNVPKLFLDKSTLQSHIECIQCPIFTESVNNSRVESLVKRWNIRTAPPANADKNVQELEERVERYEGALQCILQWADAYPHDVFTPPNYKKIHETLSHNGFEPGHTLDGVSADAMRRATEGIGNIARDAVKGAAS